MNLQTLPVFLAFLVMGVADAMGPLSDTVQREYRLSTVMATLLPFFVFIAFAVLSVPGGLLAARIGKKNLLLLGLGINAVAMLVPSVINPGFALLLTCIFCLGVGTTFLQVAGNPIMRDVSPAGAYSRNLSFAQGIKGLGSSGSSWLVGTITGVAMFAALREMGWRGCFPVFSLLMAVAFVSVALLKIEETRPDVPPSIGSSLSLLSEPTFALAVLGIFLYVGAEVCMGRFLLPGLKGMGVSEQSARTFGAPMFFLLLTVGRLVGGAVLTVIGPRPFFRLSALLGVIGAGILMTGRPALAVAGVVLAGLGFANIWPLLFSITVEERPDRASELSGLMCMAISGGALVPLVMGRLVDGGMQSMAFVVPAVCFLYLLVLSLNGGTSAARG